MAAAVQAPPHCPRHNIPIRTVSKDQRKRAKTVTIIPLALDLVFVITTMALFAIYLNEPRHSPIQIHALHGTSATLKTGAAIGQSFALDVIYKATYLSYNQGYRTAIKVSVFRMFIVAHDFVLYSLRNSEGLEMEHVYDWVGICAAGAYMLFSIMVPILTWAYYYKAEEEVEMQAISTGGGVNRYASMELDEDDRYILT